MSEDILKRYNQISQQSDNSLSNYQSDNSILDRFYNYENNTSSNIIDRFNQLQYGYPPSSLNLDKDEIDNRNLAMGDKELEEEAEFGFFNSLARGFASGATLGYSRRLQESKPSESMTFSEQATELVGELGGGLVPFALASAAIGTVGAPLAVAGGATAGVYKAISSLNRSEKVITKLTKAVSKLSGQSKILGEAGSKATGTTQRINQLKQRISKISKINLDNENVIREAQRQYTKKLTEQNTLSSLRELKRITKTASKSPSGLVLPMSSGKLAKSVSYNKMVKNVAETYGYKGAQVLNRFVNNIGTFAAIGMVADKPGYDFSDRIADLPKEALMGSLFSVAGLPSMYGKTGATLIEPAAMYGLGAYSDYLTGSPDPNMTSRDRLLHGLSLVAFHEVGQRASNSFAKEKMYRGLVEMGFNPEVAIKTVYQNKSTDAIISKSRDIHQKRGTLLYNKKNPSDVIAIIGASGQEKPKKITKKRKTGERVEKTTESKPATISYRNLITGEKFTVEGKTMLEATKKLRENYSKVDFKDKDLINDLPPEVRKNADAFYENLQTDFKKLGDISISRAGVETKGKDIQKYSAKTEEIVFGEKGFAPKKQSRPSEERVTYNKKLVRSLESIKNKIRSYSIDKVKETDSVRKGFIVRWVKDGVDQLTRKDDGQPMSVKVSKVDSKFAYFKSDPNLSSDIKQNRIPLEQIQIAKKPFAKPRYKLRLLHSKDESSPRRRFKDENWSDPQELIFASEKEARSYAEKNWVEGSLDGLSNKSIDYKLESLQSEINSVKKTKEYKNWEITENKFNKASKDYGLSSNEKKVLVQYLHPESIGDIKNLTKRQVDRLVDTIRGDEYATESVYNSRISLPPEGIITKMFPSTAKAFRLFETSSNRAADWVKRVTLPVETIISSLPGGSLAGLKMLRHGWWRQSVVGTTVNFHKNLGRKFKQHKITSSYIDKHIQAFMDTEVFGALQNTPKYQKFAKKMNSFNVERVNELTGKVEKITGLEYAKELYNGFYDEMAKALISSESFIRDSSGSQFKRKPFFDLYDLQRKSRINLVDMHSGKTYTITERIKVPTGKKNVLGNPVLKTETVTREVTAADLHQLQVDSFLDYAKGKSNNVINQNGTLVSVDSKKSKHFYVKNYSRRQITDKFFDFISSSNDTLLETANYMAKNDPMFKDLKIPLEQKRNKAVEYIKMLQKINGQENVSGQQYTRVADLPAYFYISRAPGNKGDIIRLKKGKEFKENGDAYKSGEIIVDEFGNTRKVAEVVPVYETDYSKVIDRYGTNVAHSTATYHSYPGKNTQSVIDALSSNIENQTGDRYYGDFVQKSLKSQVFGEKSSPITKGLQTVSAFSAKVGLSFPISGLKNALLGNRETISVFTGRELWKGYFSRDNGLLNPLGGFSKKWKSELDYARDIGATYTGAYELYMSPSKPSGYMKKFINNAGLMVTSEVGNRTISQAVGSHALNIHIANLSNYKLPSTKKISPETSRRILMDVLKFSPDEISSMVNRHKQSKKAGYEMQYSNSETNKARQQAHIITQGSGELPFMPLWLGSSWAKPLSLFYRVAYRVTESTAKNVVKPIVTEGNFMPAMKYIPLSVLSGWANYQFIHWAFDEERVNKFKSLPSQYFDYFLKAEGLALFSNTFNDYGGPFESYYPVPVRHVESLLSNVVNYIDEKKTGKQAGTDFLKEVTAAYNGYERALAARTGDTTKKVKDSKRRQRQFDDAFYPKEKVNIDFDDGITVKTPYYRALRDVFWDSDKDTRGKAYYSALVFAANRISEEKGINYLKAEVEARQRLKGILTRMRPIPYSWRKTRGKTGKSKYNEYLGKLNEEDKISEQVLDELYTQKLREFYKIMNDYKTKYYKRG